MAVMKVSLSLTIIQRGRCLIDFWNEGNKPFTESIKSFQQNVNQNFVYI